MIDKALLAQKLLQSNPQFSKMLASDAALKTLGNGLSAVANVSNSGTPAFSTMAIAGHPEIADIVTAGNPGPVGNLSKLVDIASNNPFANQNLKHSTDVLATALSRGYDPKLLAEHAGSFMGIPELESEMFYGDNFDEGGAFPSDWRPKQVGVREANLPGINIDDLYPANTSAQAFLSDKPSRDWKRPSGNGTLGILYGNLSAQTPIRK